jgi:hypothetical protein
MIISFLENTLYSFTVLQLFYFHIAPHPKTIVGFRYPLVTNVKGREIRVHPTGQSVYTGKPTFQSNFLARLATLHIFEAIWCLNPLLIFLSTHNSIFIIKPCYESTYFNTRHYAIAMEIMRMIWKEKGERGCAVGETLRILSTPRTLNPPPPLPRNNKSALRGALIV